MVAMPIYGKNLKKSSSLEPQGEWPWKLVCCIGYYQVCSNDDSGMTLTYFIGPLCFCMEKKIKQWIFSETIVVYDIKIGRCSQLNEYMKLYEYQRSRSFIDLFSKSLRFNIFKLPFINNHLAVWSQVSDTGPMVLWFIVCMDYGQNCLHVQGNLTPGLVIYLIGTLFIWASSNLIFLFTLISWWGWHVTFFGIKKKRGKYHSSLIHILELTILVISFVSVSQPPFIYRWT